MKITAEIVNGKCPTCDEFTMLVGLTKEMYRCMNCGADLEQHINGKISYLPHITRPDDMKDDYKKENPDIELMNDKLIGPKKSKLKIPPKDYILPLPKPKDE